MCAGACLCGSRLWCRGACVLVFLTQPPHPLPSYPPPSPPALLPTHLYQASVLVFLTLVAAPSDSVLSFRVLAPGSTQPLSVRLPLTLPDFLR